MIITLRRDWKPLLLSIFASMPVILLLVLSIWGGYFVSVQPWIIVTVVGLFLLESAALYFLFHIRRWWSALLYGIFLFFLFVGIIIFMARFIGISDAYRFYVFQISPFICITIVLLKKYLRRRVIESSSESVDLLLLLLGSFFIVFHAFKLRLFINGEQPASVFNTALELWEVISFIPLLLLLVDVRRTGEKRLLFSGAGIFFQNTDITESFSADDLLLLAAFLKHRDFRATCGDIVVGTYRNETVPPECTDTDVCKASLCQEYKKIYRRISRLRRKMETLGIGGIGIPDNKQNISLEGWRLHFFSGVKVRLRKSFFQFAGIAYCIETNVHTTGSGETRGQNIPDQVGLRTYKPPSLLYTGPRNSMVMCATAFTVFAVWTSDLLYSCLAWHSGWLSIWESGLIAAAGLFLAFLSFLSFIPNRRKTFIIFIGVVTLISLALTYILDAAVPEEQMLFSLLKTCMLFLIVYYANLPRFLFGEGEENHRFTVQISFWIIWFYLMGLLVIRNTFLSPFTFFIESGRFGVVMGITDQFLFLAVLFVTLLYTMRQHRQLVVSKKKVFLNGNEVGAGVAPPNIQILRKFLSQREGTLVCSAIIEEIYPAEIERCAGECKSSVCPAYQKIYKRIREIRNFLETLDVGTILSPAKNANVKEEGWKLLLYRDVRTIGR